MKLVSSSGDIAIFSIQENNLESILPIQISNKSMIFQEEIDLTEYLSLLSLRKGIFSSENWEPLFRSNELKEIKILFANAIKKNPAIAYLILIKRDDPLSPLTKVLRTSLLVLKTEKGLVIGIPDILQNITFASQYNFDDWTLYQIPKIEKTYKSILKLKSNQIPASFYREEVGGKPNDYERILIVSDESLLPNPPIFRILEEDELTNISQPNSIKDRLKALEEIKNQKLITEEEYQNKKKEILKNL
ncbi:MAG: SHOCT domain-containing protein [Leptospira sp.]|nr:SHOCT domain-containing protein [Leptospira sp.]